MSMQNSSQVILGNIFKKHIGSLLFAGEYFCFNQTVLVSATKKINWNTRMKNITSHHGLIVWEESLINNILTYSVVAYVHVPG